MKPKEKRKVRGYKIADKPYSKAMKRSSKKNQIPLSNIIEHMVDCYGDGYTILACKNGFQINLNLK